MLRSPDSGNDWSLAFSIMSLRRNTTSGSRLPVLQVLLLLSLLLMVPSVNGKNIGRHIELRCKCVKTISGIHPSNIQKLEVITSGPHCTKVQVIATLKEGAKVCLDPDAPRIKKIVQKFLESNGSSA